MKQLVAPRLALLLDEKQQTIAMKMHLYRLVANHRSHPRRNAPPADVVVNETDTHRCDAWLLLSQPRNITLPAELSLMFNVDVLPSEIETVAVMLADTAQLRP